MRKPRFWSLFICVVSVLIISIIGYSSWLIVTRKNEKAATTDVIAACECQSFITSLTYEDADLSSNKNGYGRLALTDAGKTLFGADSNTDLSQFTITLLDGDSGETNNSHLYDGRKRADLTNDNTWLNAAGIFAGEYHYKIVETATGQLVCADHVLTIDRREVEFSAPTNTPITFVGKEATWTGAKLVASDGTTVLSLADVSYTPVVNDYGGSGSVSNAVNYATTVSRTYTITGANFLNNNTMDGWGAESNTHTATLSYTILGTTFSCTTAVTSTSATSGRTYYANIQTAIDKVTSGTIIPMQSFTHGGVTYTVTAGSTTGAYAHEITKNSTIPAGVTLEIPILDVDFRTTDDKKLTSSYDYLDFSGGRLLWERPKVTSDNTTTQTARSAPNTIGRAKAANTKNAVTVKDGFTLDNKGTITISAIVSGGSQGKIYNSIASGLHAKILLGSGSTLSNSASTSIINCYGYIDELTSNNGSLISLTNGVMSAMFSMVEHRGGSTYLGMSGISGNEIFTHLGKTYYAEKIEAFPFNRFCMYTATAKIQISESGALSGIADMYANDSHNITTIQLAGKASSGILQMSEGTVVECKLNYDSSVPLKSKIDLDIYGGFSFNPLVMELSVEKAGASITVNLSTAKILFPLTYNWDVSFNRYKDGTAATANLTNQGLKLLPGSVLTIGEGVTANASGILVYDYEATTCILDPKATDSGNVVQSIDYNKNGSTVYNTEDAALRVAGTLNAVNLGGRADAIASTASIKVTGSSSITSPEIIDTESATMNMVVTSMSYYEPVYSTDTAYPVTTTTAVDAKYRTASTHAGVGSIYDRTLGDKTFNLNTTYTAVQATDYYWRYQLANVVLSYEANGGTAVSSQTIRNVYSDTGVPLTSTHLPAQTRNYYNYGGWYTDSAFSTSAIGKTIYESTTLYAKWTAESYTASFVYDYGFTADSDPPTAPLSVTFTAADTVTLPTPDAWGDYVFVGWFADTSHTDDISGTSVLGSSLLGHYDVSSTTAITLRGLWTDVNYKVNYYAPDGTLYQQVTYSPAQLSGALLSVANASGDIFGALDITSPTWYGAWTHDGTRVYKPSDFIDTESGVTEYDLYPAEIDKYVLNLDMGVNDAIADISNIYVSDAQLGSAISDIIGESNITALKQYDEDLGVSRYFKGFTDGTNAYTLDSALTADALGGATIITLTVEWNDKVYIMYTSSNTDVYTDLVTYDEEQYYLPGTEIDLLAITGFDYEWNKQYYLESWTANGTELSLTAAEYTLNESTEIVITWGTKAKITISNNSTTIAVTHIEGGGPYTSEGYVKVGDKVSATITYSKDNLDSFKCNGEDYEAGTPVEVTADGVAFTGSSSCVAAGTLITLADGTQKKVEDLLETDILLVFDHETGKFVEAGIIFIEDEGYDYYNVINLKFSDGTITRLIYEHALFDATLNKYVYIREDNYSDYVGHEFVIVNNGVTETVTLDEAYVTYEYTGCYSLVTAYHLNYFIDGLMSIPGGIDGLFNIFEYGEGYKYDEQKMKEDIEKYGLYTYEDFEEYVPEEIFHIFQAQYLKISVEKGYITFDEILALIERYIVGHGFV